MPDVQLYSPVTEGYKVLFASAPPCQFIDGDWCITHKRYCEPVRPATQSDDDVAAGWHYLFDGKGAPNV